MCYLLWALMICIDFIYYLGFNLKKFEPLTVKKLKWEEKNRVSF